MKRILCGVCLFAAAVSGAQDDAGGLGGYTSMTINDVGKFSGTLSPFAVKEMTGGVDITLTSDDPGMKPLPMRAYTMRFTYAEGAQRPSVITMEGNVRVTHPQGQVSAEKAVWDFGAGELVFTGDPSMDSEQAKGVKGSKFILNFNENSIEIEDMKAANIPTMIAEEADPSLLLESDIGDWSGFVDALKGQMRSDAASPGKQLVAQLEGEVQGYLANVATEGLVKQKGDLLKQLNSVLKKPGMYSREAYAGVSLGDEVKGLLAKGSLMPAEQSRQNRLLLEAAYPQYIVSR